MSQETSQAPAQEPPKAEADSQQKDVAEIIYPTDKPAESTPAEAPKEEPAKSEQVQTKPEEVLKLPEDAVLDESKVKEITEFAKLKGISNDVAQEILNRENTSVLSFKQAQEEKLNNEIKGWAEAAKNDKEIGGEKFKESVELAKRVIDRWGTPELKQVLEKGLGNHPEAIRVFAKIGKDMLSDDKIVIPNQNVKGEQSVADLFYPSKK